jgi:hypothetical protein
MVQISQYELFLQAISEPVMGVSCSIVTRLFLMNLLGLTFLYCTLPVFCWVTKKILDEQEEINCHTTGSIPQVL